MDPVAQHIGRVIKHALVPALRGSGFRGSGRTFHHWLQGVVQVVNVQASSSNFGDTGRFTINLGVFFPAVAAIVDPGRVPEKPKEYECTLRTRIGVLTEGSADLWWYIDSKTVDPELGDEVARTFVTFGAPWLERHSRLEAVLEGLGRNVITRAASLMALGRADEAKALVQEAIADDPERTGYLADWSQRRGLLRSQ